MPAPAMIGMHQDLSPHQMQVVASRKVHRQHADGLGGVIRYVEVVLSGLKIPAITQIPDEHFWNGRKVVGVVDLTRRLLDVGDDGDPSLVVRLDAYERHQTRVP
jgi:hypothetical protein